MREVKFEKDGKEETCYIKSAAGYDDGYYWDCSATVIFNDEEYSIQDAGSGSGWVPFYQSISKDGPCKLTSIMQLCETPTDGDDKDSHNDWDYIESVVVSLMYTFFDERCTTSYEYSEGEGFGYEIYIDGKKKEEKNEEN